MLQGVQAVGLVIVCETPECAAEIAADIGECAVDGDIIRIAVFTDGVPNPVAISALARITARRIVGAIDGLTATLKQSTTP